MPLTPKELEEENALLIRQLHQLQGELERVHQIQATENAKAHAGEPLVKVGKPLSFSPLQAEKQKKVGIFERLKGAQKQRNDVVWIRKHGALEVNWYLRQHPDVAAESKDPVEHYCRYGAKELRNPSPFFNTRWYLEKYPDVAKKGINPLYHYLRFGQEELRQPAADRAPGSDVSFISCMLEDLKKERDHQRSKVKTKAEQLSAAVNERDELQGIAKQRDIEIKELKAVQAEITEERNALADKLKSCEQALMAESTERKELQSHIFSTQEVAEQLHHELHESKCTADVLKQDLAEQQEQYTTMKSEYLAVTSELESVREFAAEQATKLEQQLHGRDSELAELSNALKEERKSSDALRQEVSKIQRSCDELKNKNRELEAGNEQLKQQLDDQKTSSSVLGDELQQLTESHRLLENDKEELISIVEKRDQELKALNDSYQALSAKQKTLENELASNQQQLQDRDKTVETLKTSVSQLESKLAPLEHTQKTQKLAAEEETQQALQAFGELKQWLITEANS
ncbi:MAG: ELKS/Rab6-interacting/CAST family member 1-like protein [Marinobacter sp. T13-3]|nr:MAG: ELKS/Rab6-interacting/CAST family member 1-like protein [Marinobacter sp. T13-3]